MNCDCAGQGSGGPIGFVSTAEGSGVEMRALLAKDSEREGVEFAAAAAAACCSCGF